MQHRCAILKNDAIYYASLKNDAITTFRDIKKRCNSRVIFSARSQNTKYRILQRVDQIKRCNIDGAILKNDTITRSY
jgi:hypothetical protein